MQVYLHIMQAVCKYLKSLGPRNLVVFVVPVTRWASWIALIAEKHEAKQSQRHQNYCYNQIDDAKKLCETGILILFKLRATYY